MAPPLARGSTPERPVPPDGVHGSPARAGIDRRPAGRCRSASRLPRSRGDRPGQQCSSPMSWMAPPLARGSTWRACSVRQAGCGSPARAGIDPFRAGVTRYEEGLPRSRGDRPGPGCRHVRRRQAPPLARGSTPADAEGPADGTGSPARAGIDPRRAVRFRLRSRLPRSRGDRPRQRLKQTTAVAAPPLARGSTRCHCPACWCGRGSPARAGIDLRPSGSS